MPILNAQIIEGKIYGPDSLNQNPVIIEFKDSLSSTTIVKEFIIVETNYFKHKLKKNYNSLLVCANSFGYKKRCISIKTPNSTKNYNLSFDLGPQTSIYIDEVIIKSKKLKYSKTKDTITFRVDVFKDGTEKKIEDVLKNIPGIEVNEQSGNIRYKGVSIETVTLDGDNLFGDNYSLGTKNINVDMVTQIEAIDNYVENPLLRGIEAGGKVLLNLKLKQGKLDVSGNFDFGSGRFENDKQVLDMNSNILGITKTYKSFATLAFNNIGINHSPFDYFGFNFNMEQIKEEVYFAKKIIPETRFSNLLDDKRTNLNNQFFGNYNAIFKLNSKLSVKVNLYYLKDRITTNQLFENQFDINNENFITSDNTFITKNPQQYRGDIEIKYGTSKTSLLEYNVRVRQENIETPSQIIQNQTNEFSSSLKTKDFYLRQDLLWTKKLSDKKALQVSIFYSLNDLPQSFNISPSLLSEISGNDIQESRFKKMFLEGKSTYLGSGKRDKYSFTLGANLNDSPFKSRLFNSDETFSENNFIYTQSNIFNKGVYNFNRGNWKVSPSYSVSFKNQNLKQNLVNQEDEENNLIFEPALNVKYTLNSKSFLTANFNYNQTTNTEQYFFLNQVLIDNRTTIENTPSLELQNSQRYSLLYFNNDLYNQFQLNANVSYQKSIGNFFTNQNITENTSQIEYFFSPQKNSNLNLNLQVSKYIPFIESTLKISSNYSISNFRNIINNSELRINKNQFLSNSFFWKTALDIPINFENTFNYQYSNSKSQNQSAFINKSWKNTFKIIVKPNKKWFIILSSNYYLPNTNQSDIQFFFLDTTLRHKPKNKKWEASFVMQNLTNEVDFEQIQTSDISTTIFRSNLLPRYLVLNLTWNF